MALLKLDNLLKDRSSLNKGQYSPQILKRCRIVSEPKLSKSNTARLFCQNENSANVESFPWDQFAAEIDSIGKDIEVDNGQANLAHLRKMELWGRLASFIGYATAWIVPNPISAYLISHGNFVRWTLFFHPVSHGTFDHIPNVPNKYKSTRCGRGYRRLIDWFDWITPSNWHDEHDKLHHYHLGSPRDPDVVSRNAAFIRKIPAPAFVRYTLSIILACVWKPMFFAVETLAESRHQRGLLKTNRLGWNNWNPLTPEGRELWLVCLLPYIVFRFIFLPALFLPLGEAAAVNVLWNSLFAEGLTNFFSFMTIAPNHTGDDLYNFLDAPKGKGEYYVRQIAGTVSYPAGNDLVDFFFYGGTSYQIEHHLWPEAYMLQCRRVRPRLKQVCEKYGVQYIEGSLLSRFVKTLKVIAGTSQQLDLRSASRQVQK